MLFLRLVDLGFQVALLPAGDRAHLRKPMKISSLLSGSTHPQLHSHWGEYCLELSLQTTESSNAVTGSQRMLCLKWTQFNLCTSYLSRQKWYRSESRWGRNNVTTIRRWQGWLSAAYFCLYDFLTVSQQFCSRHDYSFYFTERLNNLSEATQLVNGRED